jgi:hypothetical protein
MFFCLEQNVANPVFSWCFHHFVTGDTIIWWLNKRSPPSVVSKKRTRHNVGCAACRFVDFYRKCFRILLDFRNIFSFHFDFCQGEIQAVTGGKQVPHAVPRPREASTDPRTVQMAVNHRVHRILFDQPREGGIPIRLV